MCSLFSSESSESFDIDQILEEAKNVPDVVIIGGGFAGCKVARSLEKFGVGVTLIDEKDFFEATPSILRCLIIPEKGEYITIPHEEVCPSADIVIGTVEEVTDKHVILNTKDKIPFDYLIIATGSRYNIDELTLTTEEDTSKISETFKNIRENELDYYFFRLYCRSNWCEEGILFIDDAHDYLESLDNDKEDIYSTLGESLMERYILPGSPLEINIAGSLRNNIITAHVENGNIAEGIGTAVKEIILNLTDKIIEFTKFGGIKDRKSLNHEFRSHGLQKKADKLRDSEDVIIVGGGPVGVELVGEIVQKYPNKPITLIHSKERLLERLPQKVSNSVNKFMKNNNVNVVLNTRALRFNSINGKMHVACDNDDMYSAECFYYCGGAVPNSEFMFENFRNQLTPSGHIIVNKYFQVENHEHIFAIGDVSDICEERTAQRAIHHGEFWVKNFKRLLKMKPLKRYKPLKYNKLTMIVSLGSNEGTAVLEGHVVSSNWITSKLKQITEEKVLTMYGKEKKVMKIITWEKVLKDCNNKQVLIEDWNQKLSKKCLPLISMEEAETEEDTET
eukprot:TRINITY_DN8944_c0_g1_i1.p1 TRINITY_DN8944_c0_g1~~TRINITY_DN8944_c0_g1_i1.p1  ORF type:complete len:563 (-),score=137.61 TRINITY_DN8944_c0_g1_i1:50-1738(-)